MEDLSTTPDVPIGLIGAGASTVVLQTKVTGDAQWRYTQTADGTMSWGPGTGAADVTLSRNGAGLIEQKSGAVAQTFRIYGTTAGPAYVSFTHDGVNASISVCCPD